MKLRDHEEWIRYNAPHMTVFDMMDELDYRDEKTFRSFCKALDIQPLREGDKVKKYILDLYHKKPQSFFVEKLGYSLVRIQQIYHELNIEEPAFPAKKSISVREIFARTHRTYMHFQT